MRTHPPSKKAYRVYVLETEEAAKAQQWDVEPLILMRVELQPSCCCCCCCCCSPVVYRATESDSASKLLHVLRAVLPRFISVHLWAWPFHYTVQ
jgi:hypothetical protein